MVDIPRKEYFMNKAGFLFSKPLRKVLTFAVFLIFCLVGYALYRNAEIAVGGDSWVSVKPLGNEKKLRGLIDELEKTTVSKESYGKLQEELILLQGRAIEVSEFPRELKTLGNNRDSILSSIRELLSEQNEMNNCVVVSYAMVFMEITINGTINTKLPVADRRRQRLYYHIQKCLASIAAYNKTPNGEQSDTYLAVTEFQQMNKLKVDGMIGKKTWTMISNKFEQLKLE